MSNINLIKAIYILCLILNNCANSTSITLNLAYDVLEKTDNKKIKTTTYKHKFICKTLNSTHEYYFNNFNYYDTKIVSTLALKSNGDFILTGLDSYPISLDGNCTINGNNYNLQKECGIPNYASHLLIVLNEVFFGINVKNIIINGNTKFKPVLFIDYNGFNIRDINIKCSNTHFIQLNFRSDNISSNCCEINNILTKSRYTVFQSNIPVKINDIKYNANTKLVIMKDDNKIIPYNNMYWNLV